MPCDAHRRTDDSTPFPSSSLRVLARKLLTDPAQDPLAKEIISRVDNSPYGFKGRSRGAEAPASRSRAPAEQREGDRGAVHATQ